MIIAGTGHRPDKLGGYSPLTAFLAEEVALNWLHQQAHGITGVISGMAQGWDQALASAALSLSLPLHCAIPFDGQESRWPDAARREYRHILAQAASVTVICEGGFSNHAMQVRNEWMVDRCHLVLALWDGSSGGTGNCIRYAQQFPRPIVNLWPRYRKE